MTETYLQAAQRFTTARDRTAGTWIGGRGRGWGHPRYEAQIYKHGAHYFIRIGRIDVVQITARETWILRTDTYRNRYLLWAMNDYAPGYIASDLSGQWVLRDDSPFYDGIEIDSLGFPVRPTPKKIALHYAKVANEHRLDRNEVSRAYARSARASIRMSQYYSRLHDRAELPISDFPHLRNVKDRQQFISIVGLAKILDYYNAKVVDVDAARGYKLLAISDEDLVPEYDRRPEVLGSRQRNTTRRLLSRAYHYLQMLNPSTGEIHVECVTPECLTVADALQFRNGSAETPTILT